MYNHKVISSLIDGEDYTYADLMKNSIEYYKISKSANEIAEKCCEDFTTSYIEGTFVESTNEHGLSFTLDSTVICCIPYGDQLTKFGFNQSNVDLMENCKYKLTGNVIPEFIGFKLYVEKNFSLKNPETLLQIIKMSQSKWFKIAVNNPLRSMDISNHLEKLNFFETQSFWNYLTKDIKGQQSCQIYKDIIDSIEEHYKNWLNS